MLLVSMTIWMLLQVLLVTTDAQQLSSNSTTNFIINTTNATTIMNDQVKPPLDNESLSTEALFDMIIPPGSTVNTDNEENEDMLDLPYPIVHVEHYLVSWNVVMALKRRAKPTTNSTKTSEINVGLDDFFLDRKNRFQFEIRLECPTASQMVMGLFNQQGQQQRPTKQQQQSDQQDSIACGPPLDMSRNVLECRGNTATMFQAMAQSDTTTTMSWYNFVFDTVLEMSCLTYDKHDLSTNNNDQAESSRNQRNNNRIDSRLKGLIVTTPTQQVKTRSNMIFGESWYAAQITNLTSYLSTTSIPVTNDTSMHTESSLKEPVTGSNKNIQSSAGIDASEFSCQRQSTPTTTSSNMDHPCPNDKHDQKGVCTRQMTCYYSAMSNTSSCTSSIPSMVLTSLPLDKRHRNLQQTNNKKLSNKLFDKKQSPSKHSPMRRNRQDIGSNKRTKRNRLLGSKNNRWIHESRYRILWTIINMGCDAFPIMMDVTCVDADTISLEQSTPSIPTTDNVATSTTTSTYRHTIHEMYPLQNEKSSSKIECYPSLFHDNTLHCRREIPTTTSVHADTLQSYQELLEVDFLCSQTIDDESEIRPNLVKVNVLETSNIQCYSPAVTTTSTTATLSQPSLAGSAVTVVPVTIPKKEDDDDKYIQKTNTGGSTASIDPQGSYVLFPPLSTGTTFDPATSVTCSSPSSSSMCQHPSQTNHHDSFYSYDFYVNYNNSIGNKVAQVVRGCQNFASCPTTPTIMVVDDNRQEVGCINSIPPMTIFFQDATDTQYLSRIYPTSAASPGIAWNEKRISIVILPSLFLLALWEWIN